VIKMAKTKKRIETVSIDIMFDDLKENAQKYILEQLGLKSPSEMNWEVVPITTLEYEVEILENGKRRLVEEVIE
jgi:hypothetical protein